MKIFEVEPGVTVAELAAPEKNRRSHRGQALRMMVEQLRVAGHDSFATSRSG